ncbi:uncharacterized protein LOC134533532 isoform X2 [Bacillus rossius redtenbacheri]
MGLIGAIVYFIVAFKGNGDEERVGLYIVTAVICVVELLASMCLINGALKEKKRLITPWLVITTFLLVSYFVILNISIFLVVAAGSSMAFSLSGFLTVALTVYCLVVVYSYHESFGAGDDHNRIVTYTVENHQFPSLPVTVVPPPDFGYPQHGYPQHGYPPPDYPQQQPPPYDAPGPLFAAQSRDHKLQP